MSDINFLGTYSGIDSTMVDQLMAAEKLPLTGMNTKVQTYTTEKDAWKDINTRLSSLSTKINALNDEDLFSTKKFTSSVSGIVSASVDNDAIEGSYEIEVTKLAKSTSLVGNRVTLSGGDNSADLSLSGRLNIKIDSETAFGIDVESTDSLNDIVNKINSSNSNDSLIKATIVDSRIVLNSVEAGAKNITLSDYSVNKTLNINIDGVKDFEVNYTSSDSIESIKDAINSSPENTSKVLATIVDSKLVINSVEDPVKTITTDEVVGSETTTNTNILTGLGLDTGYTTTIGNNSEFTINGISVTDKTTNSIDDVVEGLTFNLTSVGTTKLTVSKDYSSIESKIQSLVDQYNSTLTFMQQKSSSGTVGVTSSKGTLAGDSALQRLVSNLRTTISDTISGFTGSVKNASTIGIKTIDNYGTLSFDKTTFESVMESNSDGVKDFFTNTNGFANKLDKFVDTYIDSSDGLITYKQTSLQSMIDTTNDRIDAFNLRMESREAYYIKIFAALDSYMSKAESTSSWLTSQMSSMTSSS